MENKLNIQLTLDEINTIMESLGNLPYLRVYELIAKIQHQAGEQLSAAAAKPEKNGAVVNQ